MDCFYASVEEKDNPDLIGKAVIVGGTSARGVVCAANYEARKYGIRSAMPLVRALKLCPHGQYLPVRMSRYMEESKKIHEIFRRHTDKIQGISLDEAFLDVTQNKQNIPYASRVAVQIRKEIREELKLVASAGVAPNKLIAKIASDVNKPDGLCVVTPEQVLGFLWPLPVGRIWGVGKKANEKMEVMGIHTIGELARQKPDAIFRHFGKSGLHLLEYASGIDESPVQSRGRAKSIGRERTLRENATDLTELLDLLPAMVSEIAQRLFAKTLTAKTITLKIKSADFRQITRSHSFEDAVQDEKPMLQAARTLLQEHVPVSCYPVRLLGLSASRLEKQEHDQDLFSLLNL